MKFKSFWFLGIFLIFCSCSTEQVSVYSENKEDVKSHNLITPSDASKLIAEHSGQYIPIQVSKKNAFLKEHIPGALNIWRPDYGSDIKEPYGGLIPSQGKLETLLQSFGFEEGKTLLLYDVKANVDALRFAWVLNLYGFDDFKIINGGLKYWKDNGYEVTDQISSAPENSEYQLKEYFDSSIIVGFDEVRAAIKDPNTLLIDTREDYEYLGEPFLFKGSVLPHKNGAFNRGSIPSAIHLNWSTFADLNGDHRIKSERDLRHDLKQKGITDDKNIILYCHSGSRTSHTYYVLKHVLGYKEVKNYDGSWIEWSYKHSQDSDVPLVQFCSQERFEEIQDSLIVNRKNHE